MIRKFLLPLLAVAALSFAVYHVVAANKAQPKLAPPVAPARSPFGDGVAGAGLVEARSENIAVGTNLPGVVAEVLVKVGHEVKVGDPLFRLDARALDSEWQVRKAALDAAVAQLDRLRRLPRPEEVPAVEARLAEAEAMLVDRSDARKRAQRLFNQGAIGEEERVRTEQAATVAREQVRRAEADLALLKKGTWGPDLRIAEASVSQARAMLAQTETEQKRLEVRALVAGRVLQVNVRPGEYVGTQPGQALVVLGDVSRLHVRVDVDEHDIPRFKPGATAKGMLRGDPRQELALKFVRVEPFVVPKKSLTGDNTERVDTRVLQVIYEVEGRRDGLYVGQQVDAYVEGK